MNTIEKSIVDELLAPESGSPVAPEHRAWMNDRIREALATVEAGEMTYHSLEEIMREFGFDAR